MKKLDIDNILINKNLVIIKNISDGYSEDFKYLVKDINNNKYMLRISDYNNLEKKKLEAKILSFYRGYGKKYIQSCVEIDKINNSNKIYTLLTWIEGIPLEKILNSLSAEEQYELGKQAGIMLKNIHNITVQKNHIINKEYVLKNINEKINKYKESRIKLKNDQILLEYILKNINDSKLYENFSYLHGDFHMCNYIYTSNKRLGIIDFERCKVGNKYEDFFETEFYDSEISIPFAKGKIDGYFNNNPPEEFWECLLFYSAIGAIVAILWAEMAGEKEINESKKRTNKMIKDFQNFTKNIPSWYNQYQGNKS